MNPAIQPLVAQVLTPEAFRPYGQMITACADGKAYDGNDAQLDLSQGTPRFYMMRLHQKGRRFSQITRHDRCTQCLGSIEGKAWLIAVAPAGSKPLQRDIVAFHIPGNCFIKLDRGTWHAGPYFDEEFVDFYNLELSNTNLTDHQTYNLLEAYGVEFEIV